MLHLFIFGLILGWGAAIPIGPINLEVIRRNLSLGTPAGLALGAGAGGADVTYLVLLSLGALQFLSYPIVLKIMGLMGAMILGWFGWQAFKIKPTTAQRVSELPHHKKTLYQHLTEGYFLTLINPYNIIFWSSVSVTIAANTRAHDAVFFAGLGVLLGTMSWMCSLNTFLHFTRHRISKKMIHRINMAGGVILLGFAALAIWNTF